jgi:glyoxylase-like metal-dependent hydrolase (beta-lactamase superfamily II)
MQAAVIDPGGEVDRLIAEMQRLGVTPTALWLTHAHIDHAGGTGEMARRLDLPIVGPHRGDLFWIEQLPEQSRMFRFPAAEPFLPTRWLEDGDTVTLGNTEVAVRHCPGHTPGHVVFHHAGRSAASWATCCSPAPSAGRISGGDYDTLIASITQRLWPMGDETVFIPGTGRRALSAGNAGSIPIWGDLIDLRRRKVIPSHRRVRKLNSVLAAWTSKLKAMESAHPQVDGQSGSNTRRTAVFEPITTPSNASITPAPRGRR